MNLSEFMNPVFIAKVVDFVVFVTAIAWVYDKYIKAQLVAQQEAQNKAVEDAFALRATSAAGVEAAKGALESAAVTAKRMVEIARAQAERILIEERAAAEVHGKRTLAHAGGELERERYRVRRELLEETVERAHTQARELVERDLSPAQQRLLIGRIVEDLERSRA